MLRLRTLALASTAVIACRDGSAPRAPLSVTPSELRLMVGDTSRLAASDVRAIIWRSAAPTIATVDRSGLVTAITPGAASIWAIRGNDSASAAVSVQAIKCAGAPQVSPATATLAIGDTVRAYAMPGCVPVSEPIWESSNPEVATVAARGLDGLTGIAVISARRAGSAVITARSRIGPTESASMAVLVR